MKIQFCGAAQCVTGSCHLVRFAGKSILIDCGMRQGADAKSDLGEGEFPFLPHEIDAVLLTHAHIDHTGLVPLLVKRGFKGDVICTSATAELCSIMLPDSGHIQEQDAAYQNRKNERAGRPLVEPLYTVQDATNSMKQFRAQSYDTVFDVIEGAKARFTNVGHLLGSAAIELWIEEDGKKCTIAFSGDLGRDDRPIINDPDNIESADYLILEGTYGDRNHDASTDEEKITQFAQVLKAAIVRGGNIVIPAFAVGRTQELLFYIKRMLKDNLVPGLEKVPVYIDSPLGISATQIYARCGDEYYDDEVRRVAGKGETFEFPTLRVAQTADESKMINEARGCNIIISSSGMCDAGRIRHHLKHNLYRADSTVIFSGYQAEGTLGRILFDGVKKVKLFGEEIRVNATIERIEGFSGHAGRDELISWVKEMHHRPKKILLLHGEKEALESLGGAVRALGYDVEIPRLLDEIDLVAGVSTIPVTTAKLERYVQKEAEPLGLSVRATAIIAQAERIAAMLAEVATTPENDMKLSMMEADLEMFVEKWGKFLAK